MRYAFVTKKEVLLTPSEIGSPLDDTAITELPDGRYVAVWSEEHNQSVWGCLISAKGKPLASPFEISTPITTPGGDVLSQFEPVVTARADGGFMVAWTVVEYNYGYNTGRNIEARQYDADGNPLDAPYTAVYRVVDGNVITSSWEHEPALDILPDGRIVMTYQYADDLFLQFYQADGVTQDGPSIRIDGEDDRYYHEAQVAVLAGGEIAVTWLGDDDSGTSIQARLFSSDGTELRSEWKVNTDTYGSQASPSITALEGGGFAVAWYTPYDEETSSFTSSVRVQVYDAAGAPVGDERNVFDTDDSYGSVDDISVAGLPDGGFVVAYTQSFYWTTKSDIFAQRFDADGQSVGETVRVNENLDGYQDLPRVEASDNGEVTFVWSSNPDDGEYWVAGRTLVAVAEDGSPTNRADAIALSEPAGETIYLLGGNDWLEGSSGRDRVKGNAGNDIILGGGSKDRLVGNNGKDKLYGENGDDKLFGLRGNDTLFGGNGRDTMRGGSGDDSFVFDLESARHGKDRITDFVVGEDKIVIDGPVMSFDDIDIRKVKKNAILSYDGEDFAVLEDTRVNDLGGDDFMFGL